VPPKLRTFDLRSILRAFTHLNVIDIDNFSAQLVRTLAENLSTDRVTHLVIDHATNRILGSNHVGYALPAEEAQTAGRLMERALTEDRPLTYRDIREHPEAASDRADEYSTNACAVLPLKYQGIRIGALCLSNLTEEQVVAMQLQSEDLELFMALAAQYTAFIVAYSAAQGNQRMREVLAKVNGA